METNRADRIITALRAVGDDRVIAAFRATKMFAACNRPRAARTSAVSKIWSKRQRRWACTA